MSQARVLYRSLTSYKYQAMADYEVHIDLRPQQDILEAFFELRSDGRLFIKQGYAWDGPSGPTVDTPDFMRGSLVHDALYQLMRLGRLDYPVHRKYADDLLRTHCLEDGMSWFRAWYVYKAVRFFAAGSAEPEEASDPKLVWAPTEPPAA